MFVRRRWRIVLSAVLVTLLSSVSRVDAQSIIDPQRVEFTPSSHHDGLDENGAPIVESYVIDIFIAGEAWPVASADLGKPLPGADGMIRVDFMSLLPSPLAAGIIYEALVEAIGPGGRSGGIRTNTFSLGAVVCAPAVSPFEQSFTAAGGTGSSTVTTGAGCAWTAASNAAWITLTSGATGSGSGAATFSVAANPSTTSRTGTLTIAGATVTITQAGAPCTYAISPANQSFTAAGGTGSSTVTTSAGCAWTAASNAAWITLTSGATGSGSGGAAFSVAANPSTADRTGTVAIAGATFTVTQSGAACAYSVSPLSVTVTAGASTSAVSVTTQAGCVWSTSGAPSWITLGPGGSGSGSATITVAVNTSKTARTAALTIAGSVVTVTQKGKIGRPVNVHVVK
jgi:hypothetical protein